MSKLKQKLTLLICSLMSTSAISDTWQLQPIDEPNALSLLAVAVAILILIKAKNRK